MYREHPSACCIELALSSSSVTDGTARKLTGRRVAFSPQSPPLGGMDVIDLVPPIRAEGGWSHLPNDCPVPYVPPPLALQRFVVERPAAPCYGTLLVPTDFTVSCVLFSVSGTLPLSAF